MEATPVARILGRGRARRSAAAAVAIRGAPEPPSCCFKAAALAWPAHRGASALSLAATYSEPIPQQRAETRTLLLIVWCATVATQIYVGLGAGAEAPGTRRRGRGAGNEAWLIGEHRMSGEKKYYLANLPAKTDLRTLATTIKARWICEQAHQQMKEELGLDHFEGRSWQGLHRHALMTMIAYAFLQHRRLAATARKKKNQRAPASANFACRAPRHPRTLRSITAAAMPALSKMDLQRSAA